jgi:hypothetical protein
MSSLQLGNVAMSIGLGCCSASCGTNKGWRTANTWFVFFGPMTGYIDIFVHPLSPYLMDEIFRLVKIRLNERLGHSQAHVKDIIKMDVTEIVQDMST